MLWVYAVSPHFGAAPVMLLQAINILQRTPVRALGYNVHCEFTLSATVCVSCQLLCNVISGTTLGETSAVLLGLQHVGSWWSGILHSQPGSESLPDLKGYLSLDAY